MINGNSNFKIFAKLSNIKKDFNLSQKFTLLVRDVNIENTNIYKSLETTYYINPNNSSKIKIPNALINTSQNNSKSKEIFSANSNKLIPLLIINNESNYRCTIMNLSEDNGVIVRTKVLPLGVETELHHRDLIYIDGNIFYFFYSKEAKLNNLKLRFRLKEKTKKKAKISLPYYSSSATNVIKKAINSNNKNSNNNFDCLNEDKYSEDNNFINNSAYINGNEDNNLNLIENDSSVLINYSLKNCKTSKSSKNDSKIKAKNSKCLRKDFNTNLNIKSINNKDQNQNLSSFIISKYNLIDFNVCDNLITDNLTNNNILGFNPYKILIKKDALLNIQDKIISNDSNYNNYNNDINNNQIENENENLKFTIKIDS